MMYRTNPILNSLLLLITTTTALWEIIYINNSTNHSSLISCSSGSDCYVNVQGSIPAFTLNASETNSLYLICYGSDSCDWANVYGPKDGDLMITCNSSNVAHGACENMKVYANNADNVNIKCLAGSDCWNTDFQLTSAKDVYVEFNRNSGQSSVIHTENVSSSLNIICNGWHACYYSKLYCPLSHTDTSCNVVCSLDRSCSYMKYFIESGKYENLNLQCTDNKWSSCFDIMLYEISDGTAYVHLYGYVMCTEYDGSWLVYEYNNHYKRLSCDSKYGSECCPFTYEDIEIKCGELSYCAIDCRYQVCEGHTIYATNKLTLHVYCNENNINSTCNNLTIYCPESGKCYIKCNLHSQCKNMKILSIDSAKNSNINIECSANDSCNGLYVNATNVNSVTLNAIATNAMYGAEIHAEQANEFSLTKKNNLFDHSKPYSWATLYLPSNENSSININCYGLSCKHSVFYVTDGMQHVANGINIISYCQCPNGEYMDCIGWWTIHCGDNYQQLALHHDDKCFGDDCGCDEMIRILANNYIDNDDEYCFENTTTTTTIPLTSTTTNTTTTTTTNTTTNTTTTTTISHTNDTMTATDEVDHVTSTITTADNESEITNVATTTNSDGVGFNQRGREKIEQWMIISIIFIILFAIAATIICVLLRVK